MARIVQLAYEPKDFRIQEDVKATYSINVFGNEKVFQINTYGKPTREFSNVPSQVIQFNKRTALEIVKILKSEFGI